MIRRFYDSKKVRIFLTGSSAKLLSKEIATSLRGRSIATEVWPYDFHEFWKAQLIPSPKRPMSQKKIDVFYHHLQDYFSIGGFPAVQYLHENERRTILQNYVDTVIFRDIVERYKITNTSLVKYLIKTLLKNVASPFSVHKFYKDSKSQGFKMSKDAVYQYMAYIEDAFLIFSVPIFSESIRKIQTNPKKIYAVDNGLIVANRLSISNTIGNLFENLIYLDLRRENKQVWYYLTASGHEVDFVTKNLAGDYELIQVIWDINHSETYKREKRSLEEAEKELGIKGKILTAQEYLKESLKS